MQSEYWGEISSKIALILIILNWIPSEKSSESEAELKWLILEVLKYRVNK